MYKTISFAVVHFSVAFAVGYLISGNILVGGTIALVEPMINTLAYHLHEKIWAKKQKWRVNQNSLAHKQSDALLVTE